MANMSYCRFENTSNDLRDCVNVMEEAYNLRDMDLSREELDAMKWMRELCNRFINTLDHLEAAEDFYEEEEEDYA